MQSTSVIWQSPSFGTYSSSNTLATRVVYEFQPHSDIDHFLSESHHHQIFTHQNPRIHHKHREEEGSDKFHDNKEEEEFEFTYVGREEKIIYSDQIKPTYPLFNTALFFDNYDGDVQLNQNSPSPSLRKHFNEEEHDHVLLSCSSSNDADELDRVPPEMYCFWKPKKVEISPESSQKCSSTGSSKSWKFRNVFLRTNSEGKKSFVISTSSKQKIERTKIKKEAKKGVNAVPSEVPMSLKYGVLNGKVKESNRRQMYVPYIKAIVGILANANNVNRNLLPF